MARSKAKNRVTMHDVAARAGVSQPTVSLVLGKGSTGRVAEETRDRVLRAAEELGYRPNLLARGLVRQRSYALGLIVPDLSNPFFVDVVAGAQKVASKEGYALWLCETRHTPAERHLDELRSRLIDGVIIDGLGAIGLSDEALADLNPMLIDEASDRWPSVASDAPEAGRLAAEHLLELGHRRLAFLGPPLDTYAFRFRERGFVGVLRRAGVPLPSAWLRRVSPTAAGGQAGMEALLGSEARPTAVFCANDLIALGALKACMAAGVRVPRRVSLVGCDDIEPARLGTPELTTVAIPAAELGARAARYLIRRIDGGEDERPIPRRRRLGVRLVVRQTTAPPAASGASAEAAPERRGPAERGVSTARGSSVVTTLDFLRREGGQALLARVLGRLTPDRRSRVEAVGAGDRVPLSLALDLWRAAEMVLGPERPDWMERAGAFSIEASGQEFGQAPYGKLPEDSPLELLSRPASLPRLHSHDGDMEVALQEPGHVVLRLVDFDEGHPLFCRRQTGGLRRALELAGGEKATAAHIRCAEEGDAFCEWDLRWT